MMVKLITKFIEPLLKSVLILPNVEGN